MLKNDSISRMTKKALQGIKNGNTFDSGDIDIVFLIALYDSEDNIIKLSRYLMAVLKSDYDNTLYPSLHPTLIFHEENENDIVEDITQDEIYDYLINSSE